MGELNKRKRIKTDWFQVAISGMTLDGREVFSNQIDEMASTYSPKTYGARINIEHIRSKSSNSEFGMYGDVVEAKAYDDVVNGKKVRALAVKFEVEEDLIELNRQGKKVYPSIEMARNFAGTGKAYLIGLAVTDSPACLGTDMLCFSRNFNIETFTTDPIESILLFSNEEALNGDPNSNQKQQVNFFSSLVKSLFSQKSVFDRADLEQAFTQIAEEFEKHDAARVTEFKALEEKFNALEKSYGELSKTLESYSKTPAVQKFNAPQISGDESDVEAATF